MPTEYVANGPMMVKEEGAKKNVAGRLNAVAEGQPDYSTMKARTERLLPGRARDDFTGELHAVAAELAHLVFVARQAHHERGSGDCRGACTDCS